MQWCTGVPPGEFKGNPLGRTGQHSGHISGQKNAYNSFFAIRDLPWGEKSQ